MNNNPKIVNFLGSNSNMPANMSELISELERQQKLYLGRALQQSTYGQISYAIGETDNGTNDTIRVRDADDMRQKVENAINQSSKLQTSLNESIRSRKFVVNIPTTKQEGLILLGSNKFGAVVYTTDSEVVLIGENDFFRMQGLLRNKISWESPIKNAFRSNFEGTEEEADKILKTIIEQAKPLNKDPDDLILGINFYTSIVKNQKK